MNVPGRVTLAWAVALACLTGAPALAARRDASTAREPARSRSARSDTLRIVSRAPDEAAMRLGRAALERSAGNLRGVVENLEAIDYATEPTFADADRAAFLLGQAYLELGGRERFVTLARQVAGWSRQSAYTRWLAFQLVLAETDLGRAPAPAADSAGADSGAGARAGVGAAPVGAPAADALAAGLLVRDGHSQAALGLIAELERRGGTSPLLTYLKAQALEGTGGDAAAEWTRLAATDTATHLGSDLKGAALIRLATLALGRGEDPRPPLARVPAGSRYAARAHHMAGLATLERGDRAGGSLILGSLASGDTTYAARRDVGLALAGQALDDGRWGEAHQTYRRIDADWMRHREVLERLLARADHDSLWQAWESDSPLSPAITLDALPARLLADRLAEASLDLGARPEVELPLLDVPARPAESPWAVPPPPAEVWRALAASARDLGEATHALAQTRWATAREQERLEASRRYLAGGLERARREAADLEGRTSLLDSLKATLDSLDARLRAVRDEATRRVLRRTAELLDGAADDLAWMQAMRHFHLEGPNRPRALPPPAGYPSPDSVLAGEEELARAIQRVAATMAAEWPGLIARSYQQAWRPGIIDRAAAQDSAAHAALAWARALATSIDSTIAAAGTSPLLARLSARADSIERATEALRTAYQAVRNEGARAALKRALADLDVEREAIDYGLAASAYGLGVRLAPPGADSLSADGAAPSAAPDSASRVAAAAPGDSATAVLDPLETPEAVRWRREAIALHQGFLEHHPTSPARGEMRFRLADLLLVDARQEFREQMARYVSDQAAGGTGGVPLPVLSHAPALALYRAILAEDPDFEHRDAALFNAAMILADAADPEAEQLFTRLVENHPASPYCQEAYVRMGDMKFNAKRFPESVALYQRAADGADVNLSAIALYKMGWAQYNQERYLDAADAFGAVLDLYRSERRAGIQADIEGEAESYLVHSLAGAGGAPAFEAYFDRKGHRPYEMSTLLALGQHFRRFALYPEAAATDELCIRRYPNSAEALLSAQRLIDTHGRANLPERASDARLQHADRFAPGTAWYQAQSSDSVKAAGAEFARASWKAVAQERHHRARTSRSPADWRAALSSYEKVLSAWPDDPEAGTLALRAGEVGTQLGEYDVALRHYRTAAMVGPDSVAAQALWQRVAVTDAWYRSTRAATPAGAARDSVGRDSLARAVLAAADELLERFPDHPQGADLMWREGNLAFAHGWLDRAAADFGRLAERHPRDPRAPRAAILKADALFRDAKFEAAGGAYEQALAMARAAGADSLKRRAEQAIPVAYHRLAEAAVAEDSTRYERHAELFQQIATRWPRYPHAHLAQYRAGLAYARAGQTREAVRAMQAVIDSFPKSEYVRDAHLEIARAWEKGGEKEPSAAAYARFAERYPKDPGAADAWLKAADLYAAAGKDEKAQELRLAYVRRYPNDIETAMEVYEGLAAKELAAVGPGRLLSSLLPPEPPPPAKPGRGKKGAAKPARAKAPAAPVAPPSHLAEYMKRAKARPDLASRPLLAQVAFLKAEEARPAYEALRIRQPLPPSIAAKQKSLDHVMALYKQCVDVGVAEWAHAATFRIGEVLVGFGTALENSQRPADLQGDALRAYEDVLFERAGVFAQRGEGVWAELLKQKAKDTKDDPWVARAQEALWKRLGDRFYYRPEVEYPLVGAKPAERQERSEAGSERAERKPVAARRDANGAKPAPPEERHP